MKSWWKQGKTGEKRQDSAKFAHPLVVCENFAHHLPYANLLLHHFSKIACSRSLVRISQECEPCANPMPIRFFAPIFKTMLSVLENHRYAKILHTIFPCAKFIFLFKSYVLHFKVLASSSILSKPLFRSPISIHKAPLLHHSSSSTPPWQPISIAPFHSRAFTIHHFPFSAISPPSTIKILSNLHPTL